MKAEVVVADYSDASHQAAIIALMDEYARDPMGGGKALTEHVRQNLPAALAGTGNALTVLVFVDSRPVGLITCFQNLSTFKCRPLLNLHDVVVSKAWRGRGLSALMLEKVRTLALQRGCCKLTLEVLEGNLIARNAYAKFGFVGYELDPAAGKAMFWEMLL